jgi:hypothetical protein
VPAGVCAAAIAAPEMTSVIALRAVCRKAMMQPTMEVATGERSDGFAPVGDMSSSTTGLIA